jgi:hypothetical protein
MTKIIGFNMYNPFQTISLTTPQTATTSLTEVKLGSILVPANTFKSGDSLKIESIARKINTNAVSNIRLYWNTSDSISSPTPIMIGENLSIIATAIAIPIVRRLGVVTSDGSGSGSSALLNTVDIYADYITSAAGLATNPSNLALNWTVDSYIILAGDVDNASDQINCQWIRITNG